MIDIHSHILPGVDDGAETMEESLAMARRALTDGVTEMVCSSHSAELFEMGPLPVFEERVAALQKALAAGGLSLRVRAGMEIFLTPQTPHHLAEGRAWPLSGTHYVLVEIPYEPWPAYTEQALFELQVAGYTPILAHPERYVAIQRDPSLMYRLAERGVLGQVTGGAFAGSFGEPTRRCAITLAEHGLVQILASDAHSARGHRAPDMAAGRQALAAVVGAATAEAMATTAPQTILANQPLVPNPRPVEPSRSFFSRLFGGRQAAP